MKTTLEGGKEWVMCGVYRANQHRGQGRGPLS